jgi:hypothetical protein
MPISEALILALFLLFTTGTQDSSSEKVRLSKNSLTKDQVAVYRAMLNDYTKEFDGTLKLNFRTEQLDTSRAFIDQGCAEGLDLENIPVPVIHKLDRRVVTSSRIVLVDGDRQQTTIAENDP